MRRELGDPEKILEATADLARAMNLLRGETQAAYDLIKASIEEFPGALETAGGVRAMLSFGGMSGVLGRDEERVAWAERALPLAERLNNPALIVGALISRSIAFFNIGRAIEGAIVLRGAHESAQALGLRDREMNARILRTFVEQWGDPSLGVALTHEGLELARSYGSTGYWLALVGNGAICAFRVGDWEWITSIIEEALPRAEADPNHRLEYMIDRVLVEAGRGLEVADEIDKAERLFRSLNITDPQFESYVDWARAWAGLAAGNFEEAVRWANRTAETTVFFNPLAVPIAARAALWAGDLAGARAALDLLETKMYRGRAVTLDKATAHAGVAALEGRQSDALAGYREALRGWRQIGCAFDEALAVIDMVTLLGPTDADSLAEIDWARETLSRLGAQPYLDRLSAAVSSGHAQTQSSSSRSAPVAQEVAGAQVPAEASE